jgi:hypothetical protein
MPGKSKLSTKTKTKPTEVQASWRQSVIAVGNGRGFVMADDRERPVVITAARCLPRLPLAKAASDTWNRVYRRLLGPLEAKPAIAAEVMFVDPVADIAILGPPDHQDLWEQAEAYNKLVKDTLPLPVATLDFDRETHTLPDGHTFLGRLEANADAFLLSLDNEWFSCRVNCRRGIWISDATNPIMPGMSGSPIVTQRGVIGIVTLSIGSAQREGGPQAYLPFALPGWMLNKYPTVAVKPK